MFKKIRNAITSQLATALLYRLIRAYSWTFRIKVENEDNWLTHLKNGGTVLICIWHQQFFPAIRYFKKYQKYNPSLMISKSKDGEIIARVAKMSGWHPVRGSSSRGGSEALHGMIDRLKTSRLSGHVVDGPRGPAGIVKPGVIRMAHATGAMIVPFYTYADKAWYMNSWDKFVLPKPFAKVTLRFGEMIKFDPSENNEDFEKQRLHLEKIMRPELRG
ncbi:MAG: lysophospholipid acyltransferase family protein [Deltaproteobacteria bacterium]|nr:lysophospholipid acyltransferase family protein [Deltaproteobacteria bacterium]MBW2563462.1 lysophospholipid acyltransferase family protein [Deltaproteobacteria bacterium]